MGFTVLYIAFGIVALWLLGEVLFQYKAPLHWRVLAFLGFVGVVIGVASRSVVVIGLGTAAFAVGQTFVTLAYRNGYSEGWTLTGGPRDGEQRRNAPEDGGRSKPTLRVTEVEPVGAGSGSANYTEAPVPVYHPQAMNDDSGEYPAYRGPQPGRRPSYRDQTFAGPYADPLTGQNTTDPLTGQDTTDPLTAQNAADGRYGTAGYNGERPGEYGGAGGYQGADQTVAMPAAGLDGWGYPQEDPGRPGQDFQGGGLPDGGYQNGGYQNNGFAGPGRPDETAAMPMFRDERYQDATAAMPAYQDPGLPDPVYGDTGPQDHNYPGEGYQDPGYAGGGYGDGGFSGGYQHDQDGGLGRGAYLPQDTAYQQPQAAYLNPDQYQQPQYGQQPQYEPQPQPQAEPYPDLYADPYATPPGGVWVPPQQSGEEQYNPPPPADPYRY